MIISSKHELYVFFGSVIGGMILGIIFDIFKIFKPSDKTNSLLLYVHDLMLWAVISIAVFAIIFITNNAAVRWYEFAGMIIGAVVYFMTFSKLFVAMLTAFLQVLKKAVCFLAKIILFPVKLLLRILSPVFSFARKRARFLKRIYKKIRFKMKNSVKRIKHSVNKI